MKEINSVKMTTFVSDDITSEKLRWGHTNKTRTTFGPEYIFQKTASE